METIKDMVFSNSSTPLSHPLSPEPLTAAAVAHLAGEHQATCRGWVSRGGRRHQVLHLPGQDAASGCFYRQKSNELAETQISREDET